MAVYYYNGAKIITPFTIVSNEPMFDMTTVSLKTQRASQGHQRWELSFNVVNEKHDHVDVFLSSFQNLDASNTMIMPQLSEAETNTTTTSTLIAIPSSTSSGASSVTVTKDGSGTLAKGSFITFSNNDKVYIVTSDVDLSGTGTATVNIYPNLVASLTSSNSMNINSNVEITYYRDIDNQRGITFADGLLSDIGTITLIEAV
jgi:hypothetical protein